MRLYDIIQCIDDYWEAHTQENVLHRASLQLGCFRQDCFVHIENASKTANDAGDAARKTNDNQELQSDFDITKTFAVICQQRSVPWPDDGIEKAHELKDEKVGNQARSSEIAVLDMPKQWWNL